MAGLRRCRGRLHAVLILLVLVAAPVRGELLLVAEPGFAADDGSWLLPVWFPGVPAGAWVPPEVRDGDRVVPVDEILVYALQGGPALLAAVVLFDRLHDDDGRPREAEPLAEALRRQLAQPGVLVAVARCGAEAPQVPRPGEDRAGTWPTAGELPADGVRLWDGVLAALTTLADDGLPDRRVLVLVSDGREEAASRHVAASCVDAALRARVAIYVLGVVAGPDREADEARLRDLAGRTGGQCIVVRETADPDAAAGAAADLVGRIAAVRGLRLAPTGGTLPVALQLRAAPGSGPAVTAVIAVRQPLRAPGRGRWLVLGGGMLALAGAGLVLWRQRNVTVGDLLVTTRNGVRRFPVPRAGVTIGSDRDNSLVLASRMVSRHHAVIRVRDGGVVLTDLRSTRGTVVNGQPVVTHRLATGDRILVGREVELVYREARRRGGGGA